MLRKPQEDGQSLIATRSGLDPRIAQERADSLRALFFNAVLERVRAKDLEERLISTDVSAASLDSTCIKVNSAALGALKMETLDDR